jgi:dolichol-phosphate mannosyltransferase
MEGGLVTGYPKIKFAMNRAGNFLIKKFFGLNYDDITNGFKCYRRSVIEKIQPLLSNHFNLCVELPIKSIISGYSYATVPISWTNRKHGISKLNLGRMLKQYLLIVLFLFLSKYISES